MTCGIPFSKALLHPKFWMTWIGLLFAALISQLPTSFRHVIGRKLGNYIYKNNTKRYLVVKTNLTIAFPDLTESAREKMIQDHMQWYGCAMVDYSLILFSRKKRLSRLVKIDGQEHIDDAIKNNQSIIVLLAHSVMLEFGPVALGLQYETFGSYKSSKNAVLDWLIAKGRCRYTSFVVSREEGLRKLVKSLQPNRLMIFLPDEDLGKENSVFVPFFGTEKVTLTTTARIAKMGKAVALPAFSWYDQQSNEYCIKISPPLQNYPAGDAIKDATKLNFSLEELIKEHPEQYMWLLKWYRTRPENGATLYK